MHEHSLFSPEPNLNSENISTKSQTHTKRQFSFSEKQKYIKNWQTSKLSKNKFCQQNNLNLPTFCHWTKQVNQENKPPMKNFALAKLSSVTQESHSQSLEIFLGNEIRVRISRVTDQDFILKLILGLSK